MKLHTVYKGTLSGVLFALIVQKIPLSNFFYTSTATDASDKYEVWSRAVEAPKKKAGKKAPATGACRRLLRRLYIVNAA